MRWRRRNRRNIRLIKEGEEIPDGQERIATIYERTITCGHCGHRLCLMFLTGPDGKDNVERQTDHLLEQGWSHIDDKMTCPLCVDKLRHDDTEDNDD